MALALPRCVTYEEARAVAETRGRFSCAPHLWQNLAGLWLPCVGIQGAKLFDFSGNAKHGTLTDMDPAADWVASEKSRALRFVEADSANYVDCGGVSIPADFTLWALIRTGTLSTFQGIIGKLDNAVLGAVLTTVTGVKLSLVVCDADSGYTYVDADANAANNTWYSVVGVNRNNVQRLYIDGAIQADSGSRVYAEATAVPAHIGRHYSDTDNFYFDGLFCVGGIWSRAITAREVAELYGDHSKMFRWRHLFALGVVAGGTVYDETGLTVTADGVIAATDVQACVETGKTVEATGVIAVSDIQSCVETGKIVSADGVITITDIQACVETGKAVEATGAVTISDTQSCVETGLAVSADATVSVTDVLAMVEALGVSADATVSVADALTLLETLAVSASAVATVADAVTFRELSLLVQLAAVVSVIDSLPGAEVYDETGLTVQADALATIADVLAAVETLREVTATAVVTVTDSATEANPRSLFGETANRRDLTGAVAHLRDLYGTTENLRDLTGTVDQRRG